MENKSTFIKKVKDRDSWKAFRCRKEDLKNLTQSIYDHNVAYQQIKNIC